MSMDEQHMREHSKIHDRINGVEQTVSGLRVQVGNLEKGQAKLEETLRHAATKDDLSGLRSWLEKRDESRDKVWGDRMWHIVRFLLYLFGALVIVFFGLQEGAKLFFGG